MDIDINNDGVDHIRIHRNAGTELGRLLDNTSGLHFYHDKDGFFRSVNNYIAWLLHNQDNFKLMDEATLEPYCKDFDKDSLIMYRARIQEAILCKIMQNQNLTDLLRNSSLPIVSYSVYGSRPTTKTTKKIRRELDFSDYISNIRNNLKILK